MVMGQDSLSYGKGFCLAPVRRNRYGAMNAQEVAHGRLIVDGEYEEVT